MHASKNKARPLDDVDKSADRVFGIRTHDCRMVGADESTEIWWPPPTTYLLTPDDLPSWNDDPCAWKDDISCSRAACQECYQ